MIDILLTASIKGKRSGRMKYTSFHGGRLSSSYRAGERSAEYEKRGREVRCGHGGFRRNKKRKEGNAPA